MITQKVIEQLYKTYKKPPVTADDLDIDLLFIHVLENHDIAIDDHANLIVGSLPVGSPFHKIPLGHIHAIVEFENRIAIVLHSSILFLNKYDSRSNVHIRMPKRSLLDKIFARADCE
ncbi:MAG: hypothetical protein K2G01_09330 [Paramuribaculum sp.]|nr:hypothetical protein [Paramuribaculum sp.]MDE6324386.1 hypothetical protein [Paramuribaculum sp.]